MPSEKKKVKAVKAWCVCFTDGTIDVQDVRPTKREARARRDWLQDGLPPLRIIPVLITPLSPQPKKGATKRGK